MMNKNVDVLVIGAGPSGCVAAAYLHKNGLSVQVVEKTKFPRFVIGESLLPRSMDHFEEVDLLECLDAQNFEKKHGARFLKEGKVCNFDFSKKYSKGWDWTWQVPRADFDLTLVNEIIRKGVNVAFEWEVTDVIFDGSLSKTTIKNKNGKVQTIDAKFIIDSSGYGRVLPRLLDLDIPSPLPKHSSIFTHVKDSNRPRNTEGTLITFDVVKQDAWLWVIPFSNGNTSIGFAGSTEFIESYNGNTSEMLSEMLKLSTHYYDRFKDVDFLFEPINIKNYSKSVKQLYGDGYALTGNSSEFLDPVFSSGIAFATESSLLAAKLVTRQLNGDIINWENEYSEHLKKGTTVFATYVKEWYSGNLPKLFFHQPENTEIKEKICSVLAGYVWDETNPFVKKHDRAISSIAHLINLEIEKEKKAASL